MAKGERKRRRRGGDDEDGVAEALGLEASSGPEVDVHSAARDENSSSAEAEPPSALSRRRLRAQQRAVAGSATTGESENPDTTSAKPVALAEVLSNPALVTRTPDSVDDTPVSAGPPGAFEPTEPSTFPSGGTDIPPETPLTAAQEDHQMPPLASPYSAEAAPTRSREPLIVALLLLAIIVLAADTYFLLRLFNRGGVAPASSVVAAVDRPWVGVDTVKTVPFANGGQPITTVHIVNSGRLPAYDLRSNTVGSLRSASTPAPDVPKQQGPLATTGLLLPNVGGNLTFFANTRALSPEEAASVRSGQYVLWLAGRLDYKDALGRAHLTTFRYRYNPSLNGFVAAPQGNMAN